MNFKEIKQNEFLKNIFILITGAVGAQLINLVAIPIITRLYGPEAYGMLGSFVAITSIIIPIAALTYPIAIILPKDNKEAKGIVKLSVIITIFISFFILVVVALFYEKIGMVFGIEQISIYLFLVPLAVLLSGFMQIMEQWLIRTRQFLVNAKSTFYQSIIINVSNIGIGLLTPIPLVLIFFSSIKSGVSALLMYIFSMNIDSSIKKISVKNNFKYKEIMKKYKDFPIYRSPETLINDLSQSLPILMLAAFFGPISVAFYSIGRTVLSIPSQLIGKAVGDVFYPRINEAAANKEDISQILIRITFLLSIIGLVPYLIVVIYGPSLFSFIFGIDWEIAGEYARWIAVWSFFGFINQPSVRMLPVINAQKFHLIFTSTMLIVRVIALLMGYFVFNDDLISIALFSIAGAILNVGVILMTVFLGKKYAK